MRAVVFAYHNMGIAGLEALERAGYETACIISHQDDPGENCWFGSVFEWGKKRGTPVECPEEIRRPEWVERIANLRPEMIFSFYYRLMIPGQILRIPTQGAYNLHGSLLPAYRGRCPVNWVLVNGEERTGVTLHHMVKQADAGDIVGQRVVPIARDDTAFTLYGKLCSESGLLLDELLPLMESGRALRVSQDLTHGSYFGGRRPEDGRIDWKWPAARIYNLIRAVTEPYPGAFCFTAGDSDSESESLPAGRDMAGAGAKMMIWWAASEEGGGQTGKEQGSVEIEGGSVFVTAGAGRVRLLDIQIGGERMTGDRVIRYFKDKEGMVLS